MKILAFVDTHEDPALFSRFRRLIRQEHVDMAACAGDFTIFGGMTDEMLNEINTLGVPVVLIHGNHEDEDEILELLPKYPNIHWAHDRVVDLQGVRFIGFGGHGFSKHEPDLEELERRHTDAFTDKTIFLSHAPPFGTALDEVEEGWHVGNQTLTDLVQRRLPMLVLCGHIHQCFHNRDMIFTTPVINPGPDGEIIEVDA